MYQHRNRHDRPEQCIPQDHIVPEQHRLRKRKFDETRHRQAEQNWKKPEFDFSERSDRVTLKLEVGQVVYIPGAADIRNENTNQAKAMAVSKEDKILEYIRQNGSITSQKAADIGGYKSKTGARKLLDKMIEKGLITKIGNGPATKYVI